LLGLPVHGHEQWRVLTSFKRSHPRVSIGILIGGDSNIKRTDDSGLVDTTTTTRLLTDTPLRVLIIRPSLRIFHPGHNHKPGSLLMLLVTVTTASRAVTDSSVTNAPI
jgi:hypothetical protein